MMFLLLFMVISGPFYAENVPGEWVGGEGLNELPHRSGNIFANPAAIDTLSYLSVTSRASYGDYRSLKGEISSITLSLKGPWGINLGAGLSILYDSDISGEIADSNAWDSYIQSFVRTGGMEQYNIFLSRQIGSFSTGIDFGVLNGEIEERWDIDFAKYSDFNDTISTYLRGYSGGIGFIYSIENLRMGGYLGRYVDLKYWSNTGEKKELELKDPMSFGISYIWDKNNSIDISINRKSAILSLSYKFIKVGYGRIFDSGYGLELAGNRFIAGLSFDFNKLPLEITFENRRYSGDFEDNKYIGCIKFSISGKEGGIDIPARQGGTQ